MIFSGALPSLLIFHGDANDPFLIESFAWLRYPVRLFWAFEKDELSQTASSTEELSGNFKAALCREGVVSSGRARSLISWERTSLLMWSSGNVVLMFQHMSKSVNSNVLGGEDGGDLFVQIHQKISLASTEATCSRSNVQTQHKNFLASLYSPSSSSSVPGKDTWQQLSPEQRQSQTLYSKLRGSFPRSDSIPALPKKVFTMAPIFPSIVSVQSWFINNICK